MEKYEDEELRQTAEQFNHQLLTSEDQYVNELETIVIYIVKPLEKAAIRCKISGGEQEVKKVFNYLTSLLNFHITFLSVIRDSISVIPDLFKYIGFLTMYEDYLHHYDEILSIFSTWRSMEFREFITLRLQHKNVKKNIIDRLDSLPWYLYRPFDRIKEYHRFLKDIEKITKKGHEEYTLVSKTIQQIRPLYKKIKHNEDRLQQKTRLLEVQLQIHGYNKPLLEDKRFFVYNRQCQMKRRGLPGKKYKHIQIYLFNDLFLWVSARGRFKGSYSFLKNNLEITIPTNSKKGDALFSIGLSTEKQKRLIVCADDLQRDKLINIIRKTYNQCQQKMQKTMNGTNKELIKQLKRKQIRDTNIKDSEFSTSSMGTNTYNNEYSVSVSDRTDITYNNGNHTLSKISESKEINDRKQQRHQPQPTHPQQSQQQERRWTKHLKNPNGVDRENSANSPPTIDGDIVIGNLTKATTITPETSIETTPQPPMDMMDDNMTNGSSNGHSKHYHKHRHHKHKHDKHDKSGHKSKRQQIKDMEQEILSLKQQLKIKDDRIADLEQSNKTIRQTLILKDNKIHSLQDEVQHLRMKTSAHNLRAKSISNVLRPSRSKRASSFSINPNGKITRTALLPSQHSHNRKIRQQQQQQQQQQQNGTKSQT